MASFFDLLSRSSRDSYRSNRSTEISIQQQETVESISSELIAQGLPTELAGDLLASTGGFDFWPRRGRGRGGYRGGYRGGHDHAVHHPYGDDQDPVVVEEIDDVDEAVIVDESVIVDEIGDEVDVQEVDLQDVDAQDFDVQDVDLQDVVEPVETTDTVEFQEDVVDGLEGYEDQEFDIDSEVIADVIEEIDDPVVDQIVAGGNTLTLSQVQQLFEIYFSSIVNNNVSNSVTNNTYIDQSDNNANTYNIDNSINTVVDQSDNSINDSYNSSVDNSVNNFQLNYAQISLDNIITGERRGRDAVQGTGDDDLIGAGRGRDRLSGEGGADSFLFDRAGHCGRRQADVIRDFDAEEGDRILIDADSFAGDGSVSVAANRREFRQLRKGSDADFLYFQPRGDLFYNANGDDRGFGDGGLMADLKGAPELGAEQIQLV